MSPHASQDTKLTVQFDGRTRDERSYRVLFYDEPDDEQTRHRVTLWWDGSTDRPNRILCDCGARSCIPLRLVRDLEKHNGLPG